MPFPALHWWQWCLFVGGTVLLLLPVGLVLTAPALAQRPASPHAGWEAAPLPDRETPLPGFQELLDPLPLVVRDLPDAASGGVVAAYDEATLFDPQPSRDMLAAAKRAITVPADLKPAWDVWLAAFIVGAADPAPIPGNLLDVLRDDPRNGDRLSNLAVAFYFTGLTENGGDHDTPRMRNTLSLLGATAQAFPASRAAVLNYAFLSSFYSPFGPSDPAQVLDPAALLEAWSAAHPDDVTALQFLVSRHLRFGKPLPEATMARVHRLAALPDAPRAALGHALRGDLLLVSARVQRSRSPFAAEQTAREALHEYDAALALSDDPSLYAARAVTLEFLGYVPAAIEAQSRAVQLQIWSMPLRLRLADLYRERRGAESEVHAAMREAREQYRRAFTYTESSIFNGRLSEMAFRVDPELYEGDRRDVEYTAYRPARTYVHLRLTGNVSGGAASYIIAYDLIPAFDDEPSVAGIRTPADRAIYEAAKTSVVLGDPSGVVSDIAGLQGLVDDARWPTTQAEADAMAVLWTTVFPAAQLVADPPASSGAEVSVVHFAVDALRYAGLPGPAAALCRNALDHPNRTTGGRTILLECLGENAYLDGEYDVARQAFAELERPLYEGFVAEVARDTDAAIRLYEPLAMSDPDDYGSRKNKEIALVRLAGIAMDRGDARGALELYDQAMQLLDPDPTGPESTDLQYVRNNRSVARLMSQTQPGEAPECLGRAAIDCALALEDFEVALRSDPYNPLALLGKAWIERLLGHPEAAAQTLRTAVQVDPTQFPALNDLGVLAAESGDVDGARQAYLDALAANPDYSLALWNLGVLEMQQGAGGLLKGQSYMAQAILRDPALASAAPSPRFDNGVYRVEVSDRARLGAGWTFGSAFSITAATFGFATVVILLLRVTAHVFMDRVEGVVQARIAAGEAWVQRIVGTRLSLTIGGGWSRWLPLVITLPVLVFVSSWTALHDAPGTAAANALLAVFAVLTAVIAHEIGHILVALKVKARLRPAQWVPGTLLALLLLLPLPVSLSAGPYPGTRVQCDDAESAWWVHLGGPLANLLVGVIAYVLFCLQPIPGLRMIALTQLAAMGYALLPFEPLDGAALARLRPMVLHGLAILVFGAGALFSLGVL